MALEIRRTQTLYGVLTLRQAMLSTSLHTFIRFSTPSLSESSVATDSQLNFRSVGFDLVVTAQLTDMIAEEGQRSYLFIVCSFKCYDHFNNIISHKWKSLALRSRGQRVKQGPEYIKSKIVLAVNINDQTT